MSMNPGTINASLQSIWRCEQIFWSKNTGSGLIIFPFCIHKSSTMIWWWRISRQFLNCIISLLEYTAHIVKWTTQLNKMKWNKMKWNAPSEQCTNHLNHHKHKFYSMNPYCHLVCVCILSFIMITVVICLLQLPLKMFWTFDKN